jgi:predicted CXXCH cytochrome family protein
VNESPRHPGLGRTGRRPRASWARRIVGTCALALLLLLLTAARTRLPITMRAPRDRAAIERSLADSPHAGDCDRCHSMHGEDQPMVFPNALVGPDDNGLCLGCHDTPWSGGSFGGDALYRGTGHGSSTAMVWPGPDPGMRVDADAATKCLNCHEPHGLSDALGAIPMLALQREEALCLACHDGSPASTDIASDLSKPYRHPVGNYSGRHTGPREELPSDFGATPVNRRHAECVDCHNPHVSRADGGGHGAPDDASKLLLGVSRVSVINGAIGTRPLYTFIPASDTLTAPVAEYQVCFKCHSSWTTQPAGQGDLAVLLNPANPSTHPVEDAGRNPTIDPQAFAPGWSALSRVSCGDCHGSDFGTTSGPHGSVNPGLLRAPYPASARNRITMSNELCFQCHSYDVYANRDAPASVRAASRFNSPGAEKGHAEHVDGENVPCYACHTTHGSSYLPYLITLERTPGIRAYSPSLTGGTCAPTCHDSESYRVNYAR